MNSRLLLFSIEDVQNNRILTIETDDITVRVHVDTDSINQLIRVLQQSQESLLESNENFSNK